MSIWLLSIKSQELPQFPYVKVACHIPLESCRWGLQLCLRLHLIRGLQTKLCTSKVVGVPILGISGFQLWNPKTKWHLGVSPVARHREYYKGEGGGFPPSLGRGESCESMFAHGSFVHQKCSNYALTNLFGLCRSMWIIDFLVTLPSPISELQQTLLTPKCYKLGSMPQLLLLPLSSPLDS
jgi:hypothetical protein